MQAIAESYKLTASERDILQSFSDPLGQSGFKVTDIRIPDASGRKTVPMHLTGATTFLGSTATSLMCRITPWDAANYPVGAITYPAVDAGTPTSFTAINCKQAALATSLCATTDKYRMLSGALRVVTMSDPTNTAGMIECGTTKFLLKVGTALTPTDTVCGTVDHHDVYAGQSLSQSLIAGAIEPKELPKRYYPLASGATIKIPWDETNLCMRGSDWFSAGYAFSDNTASATNPHNSCRMPWFRITGMLSTTSVHVEIEYNLEVARDPETCPIPCYDVPRSMNFNTIASILDDPRLNPIVASGHSFKSVLAFLGKAAPKIGGVLTKVGDATGITALSGLGKMADTAGNFINSVQAGPNLSSIVPAQVEKQANPPPQQKASGVMAQIKNAINGMKKQRKPKPKKKSK